MARRLALVLMTLMLSACASALGDATQEITFETPGANDAVCHISNGDTRYRAWPPETITISKRAHGLDIRCLADGNREKTLHVAPEKEPSGLLNVANGFAPGLFVDHTTGALYYFPKVISVDFTQMAAVPMELPDYHKHILQNPHLFGMEEFRPGWDALSRDRYATPYELKKRDPDQAAGDIRMVTATDAAEAGQDASGQQAPAAARDDLVSDLTRQMNPQVFGAQGGAAAAPNLFIGGTAVTDEQEGAVASSGPVTIFPVEK